MTTIFRAHRSNASRISDEDWERFRPLLLDKCQTMTFPDLANYMAREHNFLANPRQLGHHIREKWGAKKYRRGGSSGTPLLDAQVVLEGGCHRRTVPANEAGSVGDAVSHNPCPQRPATSRELLDRDAPKIQLPAALHAPALVAAQVSSSEFGWGDIKTRYLWLADILIGFRDSHHAFDINFALWEAWPSSKYTLSCISTAQYAVQLIERARNMARQDAASVPGNPRSQSWVRTFMDLLNAHTYNWGHGTEHGLGQITRIFDDIFEEIDAPDGVQDRLVDMTPRGAHLDVPAYTLLRSALDWFNSAHPDEPIDAPLILNQFIAQHLSVRRGPDQIGAALDLDINCLPSCLAWCTAILGSDPHILPEDRGADGDIPIETFTIICGLWRPLLGHGLPSSRVVTSSNATPSLAWASTTEEQLGIRPPQLLCTVVCMIMAAAIQQHDLYPRQSLLEKALAGANALRALGPETLLRRFLNQTCANNWRLKDQTDADRGFRIWFYDVDAQKIEPFRQSVATALGINDLPPLEQGECILDQLALAGPEFAEEGY